MSDDENDQAATNDAFEVLHFIAAKRLALGRLTVVDATNVQPEARKPLVALAREYHVPAGGHRPRPAGARLPGAQPAPDRPHFGPHVVRNQKSQLHRSLRGLGREGFRHVHVLKSQEEVDAAVIERQPLWNNRKHGPRAVRHHRRRPRLLRRARESAPAARVHAEWLGILGPPIRPQGDLRRRSRRPRSAHRGYAENGDGDVAGGIGVVRAWESRHQVEAEAAGRDVQITHGLAESLAQLDEPPGVPRQSVAEFLDGLVSHYVLDDGKLVVAHAGMKEEMQGRGSGKVRDFALYGETTGETDEFGLPVRYNWAAEYRGSAMVVYGHTPVPEPEWLNRTINIDTGCVFGGKLTALRYPEKELVSVAALETYAEPARPFLPAEQQRRD